MVYRYIRHLKNHERYCLKLYQIYLIKQLDRYIYGVYSLNYEVKLCEITLKSLNYCFEKID